MYYSVKISDGEGRHDEKGPKRRQTRRLALR